MASSTRSNGDGSIYQRHTPTCPRTPKCGCAYIGALTVGWRGDTPIRKKVSGPSKTSVATKLRKLRDKVEAGELPQGRVPTVAEWLTYWLENVVPVKARPGTIRTYTTHVNRYHIPLLGNRRLDKLTPEHISAAWATLRNTGRPDDPNPQPLSPTTIHHTHAILSRSLKVAQQRQLITRNPATLMDAPPRNDQEAAVLTRDQAKAIIDAATTKRNGARWTVALSLGLRQGEALGLRWQDVDLQTGVITVRRALGRVKGQGLVLGPVKSKKGERAIVLPESLIAELTAHREAQDDERHQAASWWHDHDYVFPRPDGKPVDPKDDWTAWRDLLIEAELEHVKLHSARHTAGTMLIAMGVPIEVVKEILGHSNLTVTQGYTHRVNDLHLDAAKKMDAFWG